MRLASCALGISLLAGLAPAIGQTVHFPYSTAYSVVDLGVPTGVPTAVGGLTFKYNDPSVLLVSGSANTAGGAIYAVQVARDVQGHLTGFSGTAARVADASLVDGGLGYGPNRVLFFGRYPATSIVQIKPGSSIMDRIVDLSPFGVPISTSSVNFVPAGFLGAGRCKVATFPGGQWWDLTLAPDGSGTFDVTAATQNIGAQLSRSPEGFAYVPTGSLLFSEPSMLVTEWTSSSIAAYKIDSNGDPLPLTRSLVVSNLPSVVGANFDPVSGDYLFSGYVTGHIYAVRGFAVPAPTACYVNCDQSTVAPVLNANDFQCFLNRYAANDPDANCDSSTTPPVLNANDFSCFLIKYVAGCS